MSVDGANAEVLTFFQKKSTLSIGGKNRANVTHIHYSAKILDFFHHYSPAQIENISGLGVRSTEEICQFRAHKWHIGTIKWTLFEFRMQYAIEIIKSRIFGNFSF